MYTKQLFTDGVPYNPGSYCNLFAIMAKTQYRTRNPSTGGQWIPARIIGGVTRFHTHISAECTPCMNIIRSIKPVNLSRDAFLINQELSALDRDIPTFQQAAFTLD
eukprot:scaffold5085_cov115-Cylindrotheca_fusiformis.AAC.11